MSRIRNKGGESSEPMNDWGVQVIVRTTSLICLIMFLVLGINRREQDEENRDRDMSGLADGLSELGHPGARN